MRATQTTSGKDADMEKTAGQVAYELDVQFRPTYHTGEPRKTWEQLDEVCKWSWERIGFNPNEVGGIK